MKMTVAHRITRPEKIHQRLGPSAAGLSLTIAEFEHAEFEQGWCYELIHGVLVVSPIPLLNERDPNDELGYLLRRWRELHPQTHTLDATVTEHHIKTGRKTKRRVDRVIWAGLGRLPTEKDVPTVAVEFVSRGKRNFDRDYVLKRDEYLAIKVKEYWLIDRFRERMTVFTKVRRRIQEQVVTADGVYRTSLLPGFELRLGDLLAFAKRWPEE